MLVDTIVGEIQKIESVKGLHHCPYAAIEHSHPKEVDFCDSCQQEKLCNITCYTPNCGSIWRICDDCD